MKKLLGIIVGILVICIPSAVMAAWELPNGNFFICAQVDTDECSQGNGQTSFNYGDTFYPTAVFTKLSGKGNLRLDHMQGEDVLSSIAIPYDTEGENWEGEIPYWWELSASRVGSSTLELYIVEEGKEEVLLDIIEIIVQGVDAELSDFVLTLCNPDEGACDSIEQIQPGDIVYPVAIFKTLYGVGEITFRQNNLCGDTAEVAVPYDTQGQVWQNAGPFFYETAPVIVSDYIFEIFLRPEGGEELKLAQLELNLSGHEKFTLTEKGFFATADDPETEKNLRPAEEFLSGDTIHVVAEFADLYGTGEIKIVHQAPNGQEEEVIRQFDADCQGWHGRIPFWITPYDPPVGENTFLLYVKTQEQEFVQVATITVKIAPEDLQPSGSGGAGGGGCFISSL